LATVMLCAFLYVETKAEEPLLPLVLFKDPSIRVSSIANFVLGIGMFGVIIYLPLFMQGVLGISATKSGSLLTPLMLGAVTGNILGGQLTSRTGKYKILAIVGASLIAIGMIQFARLDANSTRCGGARHGIAGLGMGCAACVHGSGAEFRAAATHGNRDSIVAILPVDRQYNRCRDVRQHSADDLSSRVRGRRACRNAAGGVGAVRQSPDALHHSAAAGS
jgi:predicted MFS family arabinose efflux permease